MSNTHNNSQEKLVISHSHRKDKADLGASQWYVLIISDTTVTKPET